MSGFEIAAVSLAAMLVLIYLGMYVPIVLTLVSFVAVWVMRGSFDVALNLLVMAAAKTVDEFLFGVIPLFVLMGLLVTAADLGRDTYLVAHQVFRGVRAGLGMATVGASTVFSAITGVSIASAAVFARVSVPEMLKFGYRPRFAVGVVAGSSVLGMLIPPSLLLIVYGLLAEVSVGHMFIAGIVPGLVLAVAYCVLILGLATFAPNYVAKPGVLDRHQKHRAGGEDLREEAGAPPDLGIREMVVLVMPIVVLIGVVLGGIYGGIYTPTEAGAAGAFGALIIALLRRRLTLARLWAVLVETGHITASILFLIISASMYSRMLGMSGLPTELAHWIGEVDAGFYLLLLMYVVIVLFLGTILDSVSIMLITVPLFLIIFDPFGIDLIWFGIVTVIAVEIGLLTPPFGIACYVIRSTLAEYNISLFDIFAGAAPFALTMLAVLILVIMVPAISLVLL